MMNVLITLWSLISIIPPVISLVYEILFFNELPFFLEFSLTILCCIPGIIKAYAYSMAYFIKCDHPEYGWRECLDESEKMMNGNKWRFFCLNLSFIGWMIIGILTCGIGFMWSNAYMSTSNAIFYDELKREQGYYAEPDFSSEPIAE